MIWKSKSVLAAATIFFFSVEVISFKRDLAFLLSFIFFYLNNISAAPAAAAIGNISPPKKEAPPVTVCLTP